MFAWLKKRRRSPERDNPPVGPLGRDGRCPGCRRVWDEAGGVKRFRDTNVHWHHMCQCGTVTHLFLSMFPTYVGHGRWRLGCYRHHPNFGKLYPIRLVDETLYFYPETRLYYVFTPDGFATFQGSEVPVQFHRVAQAQVLKIMDTVDHLNKVWMFDGVQFRSMDRDDYHFLNPRGRIDHTHTGKVKP